MNKKTPSLIARLFSLWVLVFHSAAQAETSPDGDLARLDAAIEAAIEQHNVPSVAFAVVRHGHPPHLKVLGKANRETGQAASLATRYRIASVSKMVVGIAVLQFVESGAVSLDSPIAELLPEMEYSNLWAATHPVTVAHLLESTTGWDEIALKEFAYRNDPPLDLRSALQLNPDSRTSRWPPGTRHAYTNSAAAVAALLVESLSGMSFYSYAQQHIFAPLGITSAIYDDAGANLATGYQGNRPVPFKHVLMRPAGAVSMNIQDMARLAQLFVNRGAPLLSRPTVERMERQESTNAGEFSAGYGLYNYSRYYDGWKFRGHDGALPGSLAELSYSAEQGVGFVVLQNGEHGHGFRKIVGLIAEHLTEEFERTAVDQADVPAAWLSRSGYYRYINPRVQKRYFLERLAASYTLDVSHEQALFRSVFPPGWQRVLTYAGDDRWQNDKGEVVLALADDPVAGSVIHYGDRVFAPVSAVSAWSDKIVALLWLVMLLGILLYSLVWPVRWLRSRPYHKPALQTRCWLSVSALAAACFVLFLGVGLAAAVPRLGQVGFVSVGLMLSSIALALITLMASVQLFRLRKPLAAGWLYRFGALFLVLQLLVVAYLGWFGVVGIRSWA